MVNEPNYEDWRKRKTWKIKDAIYLLLRVEPVQNISRRSNYVPVEYRKYLSTVDAALRDYTLLPFNNSQYIRIGRGLLGGGSIGEVRVTPKVFLEWASDENIVIPPGLLSFRENNKIEKVLGSRERATWMSIIEVLSEKNASSFDLAEITESRLTEDQCIIYVKDLSKAVGLKLDDNISAAKRTLEKWAGIHSIKLPTGSNTLSDKLKKVRDYD